MKRLIIVTTALAGLVTGTWALADSVDDRPRGGGIDGTAIAPSSVTTTGNVTVGGALEIKSPHGAKMLPAATEGVLTFAANPGDASKTWSAAIPQGAYLLGVSGRVIVAGTNCASWDLGDGVTQDLFANDIPVALGTTIDSASLTNTWGASNPQKSAADLKITANGGNCFGLSVRLDWAGLTTTAPTD